MPSSTVCAAAGDDEDIASTDTRANRRVRCFIALLSNEYDIIYTARGMRKLQACGFKSLGSHGRGLAALIT
jgi:hypothetical protein